MNTVSKIKASTDVVEFNQFESDLAEYKARYADVVYDLTVPAQEKQARSDRYAIGKTVAELDRVHKKVKKPLKAQIDLLDGERKRIKDGLLEIQAGIKAQIEEHEAKVQAIEDGLVARVEAIKAMTTFHDDPTSEQVMDRLLELNKIKVDATFAHHEKNATAAQRETQHILTILFNRVSQAEADAAELQRLREEQAAQKQREHDARVAAEAAEIIKREAEEAHERERQAQLKAQQEAAAALEAERAAKEKAVQVARESAELAKIEAEEAAERAERERREFEQRAVEAEARAKAEAAEAARIATEKAEQAQRDKEERERLELEARQADQEHRKAVNTAARDALVGMPGVSDFGADNVITAIAAGLIPAVRIHY